MPEPPVARVRATSGWFSRASVASREGCSIHWMQFSGAPAATAASRITAAAAAEHSWALGWKANTIGLRVMIEIRHLNMTVEVGLVTGVTPATTPTGSAISMMPFCLSSAMIPTVRLYLMEFQMYSVAKMFLTHLSSKRPRPVSSTASFASGMCWSTPARAMACTMSVISFCSKESKAASASEARSARVSMADAVEVLLAVVALSALPVMISVLSLPCCRLLRPASGGADGPWWPVTDHARGRRPGTPASFRQLHRIQGKCWSEPISPVDGREVGKWPGRVAGPRRGVARPGALPARDVPFVPLRPGCSVVQWTLAGEGPFSSE